VLHHRARKETFKVNKRVIVLIGIITAAALSRLVPHPPNVTPVAAMALLGGSCLVNRKAAYVVPLASMFVSDVVLATTRYDWHLMLASQPVVYAAILATTLLGRMISDRRSPWQVGSAMLAASIMFFLVTNFAVWAMGELYPRTGAGLAACYTAGLPFFRNSLMGDAFHTLVLFGGLAIVENRVRWMRESSVPLSA
jgi:hypothetical protein